MLWKSFQERNKELEMQHQLEMEHRLKVSERQKAFLSLSCRLFFFWLRKPLM